MNKQYLEYLGEYLDGRGLPKMYTKTKIDFMDFCNKYLKEDIAYRIYIYLMVNESL